MSSRVYGVCKLTCDKAVRNFLGKLICLSNSALHTLCTVCKNKFCAVCFHKIASFNAHGFRHCDNKSVTLCCCNRCKTDTRVTACRLNNYRVRLKFACLFCIFDNRLSNSVFNRACRIKVFKLNKNCCFKIVVFFKMCNLKKRCIAYKVEC